MPFFVHQSAFPQLFESGVGINTLAAQRTVRQSAHRQAGVPVGGHVGIAGRVVGTDIVRGSGVDCFFPKEDRGRAEVGWAPQYGHLMLTRFIEDTPFADQQILGVIQRTEPHRLCPVSINSCHFYYAPLEGDFL